MTNLSPQAQEIVDAYESTTDKYKALAAVLRELVKQLKYIGITEKNILEIVDELEAL